MNTHTNFLAFFYLWFKKKKNYFPYKFCSKLRPQHLVSRNSCELIIIVITCFLITFFIILCSVGVGLIICKSMSAHFYLEFILKASTITLSSNSLSMHIACCFYLLSLVQYSLSFLSDPFMFHCSSPLALCISIVCTLLFCFYFSHILCIHTTLHFTQQTIYNLFFTTLPTEALFLSALFSPCFWSPRLFCWETESSRLFVGNLPFFGFF